MRKARPSELRSEKPFAGLFPSTPDVRNAIKADMEKRGYDEAFPVIAWNDVVVDGNTRASVADELGLDVLVSDREFDTVADALDYAVHCQKDRRNMTSAAFVAALAAIKDEEEAAAKERQASHLKHVGNSSLSPDGDNEKRGRSSEMIAETLGTNARKVQRGIAILNGPEEIKEKVESGELSISKGAELAIAAKRDPANEQREVPRFIGRIERALDEGQIIVRNDGLPDEGIKALAGFIGRLKGMVAQAEEHRRGA